jgi:glutamate 5-kinase
MTKEFNPALIARHAKRWVIKVGTSVLTGEGQLQVTQPSVQAVALHLVACWKAGKEAILVTSGAIGIGMGVLDLKTRPKELAQLQAAAAAGQGKLMQWYTRRVEEEGYHAAQILLTREDMEDRQRRLNVKATLETLLKAGIVPIINENDTVSTEEIRYGDNDLLSAHVAALIGADLLVLLTDVDHLIGPEGPLRLVREITSEMERAARGTDKESSTGGARTKFEAAKIAMAHNIPMAVLSGRDWKGLAGLIAETGTHQGKGTWFLP